MDSVQLSDGTTTIDLNDGSTYRLVNWQPSWDGRETIRFELLGTAAQIAAGERAIENALMLAQRREQLEVGNRWWLQWMPSGLTTEVSARVLYDPSNPNRLRPASRQSRRWELAVVREPFWRGAVGTIPLSNVHGTNVTTGLQVDNTEDGSRDNWVGISGSAVGGDMPALTRIIMENSYNDPLRLAGVRFGLRTGTARLIKFVLEDNEAYAGDSTVTADATCSGGTKREGTAGPGVAYPARWEISSANANKWAGMWRILLRGEFPEQVAVSANVALDAANVLLLSTKVVEAGSNILHDLGVLRLPPWPVPVEDASAAFQLHSMATPSGDFWLDYLMAIPVDEGYRHLWYMEDAAPYQEEIVDDGINDEVCQGDAARVGGVIEAVGRRVELVPGVAQRIYFSQDGDAGNEITQTVSVIVEAQPRFRYFED